MGTEAELIDAHRQDPSQEQRSIKIVLADVTFPDICKHDWKKTSSVLEENAGGHELLNNVDKRI